MCLCRTLSIYVCVCCMWISISRENYFQRIYKYFNADELFRIRNVSITLNKSTTIFTFCIFHFYLTQRSVFCGSGIMFYTISIWFFNCEKKRKSSMSSSPLFVDDEFTSARQLFWFTAWHSIHFLCDIQFVRWQHFFSLSLFSHLIWIHLDGSDICGL